MAIDKGSDKHEDTKLVLKVKLNKTAMNILIPLLISTGVFIVELYSIYYISNSLLSKVDFLHLMNTCFGPTHIATAAIFLYEFYSSSQWKFFDSNGDEARMEVIKKDRIGWTVIATIVVGFAYILCNVKVTCRSQIVLLVFQIIYMFYLYCYGVESKILEYREPRQIRNVIMSE